MDKTRIDDIITFVRNNGYNVIRIFQYISEGRGIVLDIQKAGNFGKAICLVSNTEFIVHTDMRLRDTNEDLDWSENWMDFLIKEHPEIIRTMIIEMDAKFEDHVTTSNKRLQLLKDEYTKTYNEICAEGTRLSTIRIKLKKALDNSAEHDLNA